MIRSSSGNPQAGKRCIGDECQTLPGAIIYDRQNPEPAAIGEWIRHEVQRLAVIGSHQDQHRCSCACRPLPVATLAHRQLLFPIEPEEPSVVHKVTRAPEQQIKASITEAAALMHVGRVEDENQLRDAILLTRPGDDVGPGSWMLLASCRLAAHSAGGSALATTFADCPPAPGWASFLRFSERPIMVRLRRPSTG